MQIRQTYNVLGSHTFPILCFHGETVPLWAGTVLEARRSREACARHGAEDDVFPSLPPTVHASPKQATPHMDALFCRCNRCRPPGCPRQPSIDSTLSGRVTSLASPIQECRRASSMTAASHFYGQYPRVQALHSYPEARIRGHKRHGLCLECGIGPLPSGCHLQERIRMTGSEMTIEMGDGAVALACRTLRALEQQGCESFLR